MRKSKTASKILEDTFRDELNFQSILEEERLNVQISQMIYDARTAAGITQTELARLVGTTQPTIARLENADYRGHSLMMLRRIAAALNRHLIIKLSDDSSKEDNAKIPV